MVGNGADGCFQKIVEILRALKESSEFSDVADQGYVVLLPGHADCLSDFEAHGNT